MAQGNNMGLQFGLQYNDRTESFLLCKRRCRWLLRIDGLTGTTAFDAGIFVLPPLKSARPSLTFREMEVRHLNENIYLPMKPEWKSLNLVLYDVNRPFHPVWEWVKNCYDPQEGTWQPSIESSFILPDATLKMLDGCGNVIEQWRYENVWPQVNDLGELDMGSAEYLTCDLTLRYARAWIEDI